MTLNHLRRPVAPGDLPLLSRRLLLRLAVPATALLTVSGCVTGSDGDADADASPTTESAFAVTGPPVLGPVIWSTAISPGTNEATAPVAQFSVNDVTIYAVFPVERVAANTVIRATWSLNGEAIDGVGSQLTTPRDQIGGYLEFHLRRTSEEAWPDGEYGIALTTANVLIATGSVQVVRNG